MYAAVLTCQFRTEQLAEGMRLLAEAFHGPYRRARGFAGGVGLTDPRADQGLILALWATAADARAARDLLLPLQPHLRCTLIGALERCGYGVVARRGPGPTSYAWVRQERRPAQMAAVRRSDGLLGTLPARTGPRGVLALVDDSGERTIDMSLWAALPALATAARDGQDAGTGPGVQRVGEPHTAVYVVRFQLEAASLPDGVAYARGAAIPVLAAPSLCNAGTKYRRGICGKVAAAPLHRYM